MSWSTPCARASARRKWRSSATPGALLSGCFTPPASPRGSRRTSAAGRSATGRRGRVGLVRVRARRSAAPRQTEGGDEAARDRPAAVHCRELVDAAHVAVAARGPYGAEGAVEAGTGRSRRPRILDLRSAQDHARFPLPLGAMWTEVSRL